MSRASPLSAPDVVDDDDSDDDDDDDDDDDSDFEIPEHLKTQFEEAAIATEAAIRSGYVLPDMSGMSNWPDVNDPRLIRLHDAILARDVQRRAEDTGEDTGDDSEDVSTEKQ